MLRLFNGLDGFDTPLGIIPLGTANDFATQAGIPADVDHAMDVILRRKPTRIDTASLNGRPAWLRVLAPAAGGLAAGLLVRYVSPESGGHGVVEVMEAVHGKDAKLRGRVAVCKSVAAGITIGSGGSAGREGPVVLAANHGCYVDPFLLGFPACCDRRLVVAGVDERVEVRHVQDQPGQIQAELGELVRRQAVDHAGM